MMLQKVPEKVIHVICYTVHVRKEDKQVFEEILEVL